MPLLSAMGEHRYHWRVTDRGRRRVITFPLTEAQSWRDYPEGNPEPVLETLQVHEVPETAEEAIEAFMRRPTPYGSGKS